MIITSLEWIMFSMRSAACGVTWCNRPLRVSFSPCPRCWLPAGTTIAGYGTSCACWSRIGPISRNGLEGGLRHLDVVTGVDEGDLGSRGVATAAGKEGEEAGQLPWRVLDELAPPAQQSGGVGRVSDELGVDDLVDLVRLQLQRGDHTEVSTGAADGPEQVGVMLVVDAERRPSASDDLGGDDVVDGQAVLARQVSDAAGGGETTDAHVAVVARAHGQAVRGERLGHLAPACTRLQAHPTGRPVEHLDLVHPRHVDDDPPSFVDRPLMPCPPLRTDSGTSCVRAYDTALDHLGGVARTDHQGRRAVPACRVAYPLVLRVAGLDGPGGQRRGQRVVVEAGAPLGQRDCRRTGPAATLTPGGGVPWRPPPAARGRLLPEGLDERVGRRVRSGRC